MRPRAPSPRPSRRARNKKSSRLYYCAAARQRAFKSVCTANEKKRGHVPRFFTLRGRKFPHGNFRTTRVLRTQNTTCLRNKVSPTSQIPSCDALAGGGFSFIWCFYFMMSLSCAAFATMPERASSAIRFGNTIRPLNRSDRFQTRSTCSAEPMTMQTTTIAA